MEERPIDYERYLKMAAAAEAKSFLKVIFALADLDGTVLAYDKKVEFKETDSPGRLKMVFRCPVYVNCADGVTEEYIVVGTINHAGLDSYAIIRVEGDNAAIAYTYDDQRAAKSFLHAVKQRREQRKKAAGQA